MRLHIASGLVEPGQAFGATDVEREFRLSQQEAQEPITALIQEGFLAPIGRLTIVREWPETELQNALDTAAILESSALVQVASTETAAALEAAVDLVIQRTKPKGGYDSVVDDLALSASIVTAGGTPAMQHLYASQVPIAAYYHAVDAYSPAKAWLAHLRTLRDALRSRDAGAAAEAITQWRFSMSQSRSTVALPATDRATVRH